HEAHLWVPRRIRVRLPWTAEGHGVALQFDEPHLFRANPRLIPRGINSNDEPVILDAIVAAVRDHRFERCAIIRVSGWRLPVLVGDDHQRSHLARQHAVAVRPLAVALPLLARPGFGVERLNLPDTD